jgi:hypothetical protein
MYATVNVMKRTATVIGAGLVSAMLWITSPPVSPLLAGGAVAIGVLAAGAGASEAAHRVGGARHVSNHSVHRNVNRNVNRDVNRNINRNVNRNRNINRHVDVDVDWDHRHYHPVARGVAAGVAAGVTAAAIGSIAYSLPGGCGTVVVDGIAYRECGGVWYVPRYQGSQVVYVVVNAP